MDTYLANLPEDWEIGRFLEMLPKGRCRLRSSDGITVYIVAINLEVLCHRKEDVIPGTYVVFSKETDDSEVVLILEQMHIYRLLLLGRWPRAFIEVEYILKNMEELLYNQTHYGRSQDFTLISWK